MDKNDCSSGLANFLFPREGDQWLSILRIGLATQLISFCFSLRDDWNYLLAGSGGGLISRELAEGMLSAESSLVPRLGWLVKAAKSVGLAEDVALSGAWFLLLAAGILLLTGLFMKPAAISAWFLHLAAVKSGGLLSYGVDNFLTIGLFYLMLAPWPDRLSLDARFRGVRPKYSHLSGFFRRALQLHLCIIYFFGGLTKLLGSGWWDGSNLWRALTRPPFNLIDAGTLVNWSSVFPAAGLLVCLLEISYPLLIWPRRIRVPFLCCICVMHLVIGLTMGLYLFALVAIILNLAAFAPDRRITPDAVFA